MSFTSIARFDNPIDAHLLRVELENEGFDVFIADEHLVSIQPLYSNAVGGVKVQVRSDDSEKALLFLKEQRKSQNKMVCPACGSTHIQQNFKTLRNSKSFLSYLLAMITLTYPLFTKRLNLCLDCANEFSEQKD